MTTPDNDNAVTVRRPIDRKAIAAISPLPPPEEVFADWLLSVPHGADLETAARKQIALIDRSASLHPDLLCLRTMLAAIAGDCVWRRRTTNL